MFDSTKDIFWLVAAFSLGFFTLFLCWTLFYVIMMLRDVQKVFNSFKEKIELIDKILHLIKDKLEKTSGHLSLIADSILKVITFFLDKSNVKKKRKKFEK